MPNNCLLTKLKESVANNDIPVLGSFIIKVKERSDYNGNHHCITFGGYAIPAGKRIIMKTGDGSMNLSLSYDGDNTNWTNEVTIVRSNAKQTVYFNNGNYDVIALNGKYECITNLGDSTIDLYSTTADKVKGLTINMDDLKFNNIAKFWMNSVKLTGNLESITKFPLTYRINTDFYIRNCQVEDDFKKLAYLKISDFSYSISGNNFYGNVEDYVLLSRGSEIAKDSGTFKAYGIPITVLFDGAKATNWENTLEFSWEPNSQESTYTDITCKNKIVTIDAHGNKVAEQDVPTS